MNIDTGAKIRIACATLCIAMSMLCHGVRAQDNPPSFSADQLDQLVSPVALYPDPLLSQVLTAASFPDEVVEANKWAQANKNLSGEALGQAMSDAAFHLGCGRSSPGPLPHRSRENDRRSRLDPEPGECSARPTR
jgi:hypothetical protein